MPAAPPGQRARGLGADAQPGANLRISQPEFALLGLPPPLSGAVRAYRSARDRRKTGVARLCPVRRERLLSEAGRGKEAPSVHDLHELQPQSARPFTSPSWVEVRQLAR
jgi:hypothetical protein